jgi:hypothetical protein
MTGARVGVQEQLRALLAASDDLTDKRALRLT